MKQGDDETTEQLYVCLPNVLLKCKYPKDQLDSHKSRFYATLLKTSTANGFLYARSHPALPGPSQQIQGI